MMRTLRGPDGLIHIRHNRNTEFGQNYTRCEFERTLYDTTDLEPTERAPTCLACLDESLTRLP